MTTATAVRPGKMEHWSSIFPTEQVTQQQSLLFVKKLLAIAISNITYLRIIFPEPAFGDRSIAGINVKILREDSNCPGACQVIKWMKGCFEAIDKQYLEQLIIGIYTDPNDLNSIIESYTFKFSYQQNGIDIYRNEDKISEAYTSTEIKKASSQLLRTIIVLNQTLKPLPDDVWMTVKLYYHDGVTPLDYEPPGFIPADSESFQFENEALNIKVGSIQTPFHMMKLRIKSDKSHFDESINKDKLEKPQKIKDQPTRSECEDDVAEVEIEHDFAVPKLGPEHECAVPEQEPDSPTSSKTVSEETSKKPIDDVSCPCGYNEDDGLMILCANCKYWQHGACFRLLDEARVPSTHYCISCSKLVGKTCTDTTLVELVPSDQKSTCLWRRALSICLEENQCTVQGLAKRLGVQNTMALGLFNRLEKEGFIKTSKLKRYTRNVDVKQLQTVGIPQYFTHINYEKKNENTVCEKMETCSVDLNAAQDQVNQLAKQANLLSLANRTRSKELNKEDKVNSTPVKSERFTRSKKRSIMTTAPDSCDNFEISNSQDGDGSKKRKKSSLASNSILV